MGCWPGGRSRESGFSPDSVRKLPVIGVESQSLRPSDDWSQSHSQSGNKPRCRANSNCLPCRRSWVRIPSAALQKACICRSFPSAQSAGAFASTGSHWVAAASPQRGRRESSLFAGRLWEREPVTFCGAKPHHGVGVGVHLARDRVADDGATPSGVAGGRLPATAFAHEQSRSEHRSTRLPVVHGDSLVLRIGHSRFFGARRACEGGSKAPLEVLL
jgi:hypothetical protein